MSIAAELEKMEAADREANLRIVREMATARADGKTIDLTKLREALAVVARTPAEFDQEVAAIVTLRTELEEVKGYHDLRARHRAAAQAADDHDKAVEAYVAEAKETGDRLRAEVAALGAGVNRLISIRDRLIRQGHIAAE